MRRARLTAGIAVSALVGAVLAVSQPAGAEQSEPQSDPQPAPVVYIDERVDETPNAVAVANGGVIAASLFNAKAIALVTGPFTVAKASLPCSPADVDIAADASRAWSVCQGNSNIFVTTVATRETSLADLGLVDPNGLDYVASINRLGIADLGGQVLLTSGHPDYGVLERVPTPGERPSEVVVMPDASRAYVVTDIGRLLVVDFRTKTAKPLTGMGDDVFLWGISLSTSGTSLYAGAAIREPDGTFGSAVVRLDPVTGRVLQTVEFTFTNPGLSYIGVAAGHRSLSVGAGLWIQLGTVTTGALDIALDAEGRLGSLSTLSPIVITASAVSRSPDGSLAAIATTNATVMGVLRQDPPYAPTLSVRGSLKAKTIRLTGVTTHLAPGTSLKVYVRDVTKRGSLPVQQARTANVDSRGNYTWKGRTTSKRVQVFVTAKDAASPRITLRAKK